MPAAQRLPQWRELDAVHEALHGDVRLRVLLDLSDPARGGRANVALLAARTGIDPKKLSPHLSKLKDLGLIFSQREGKETWYEAADGRVRYERHQGGHFSLTVTGRDGGVAVGVARVGNTTTSRSS